MNILPSERPSDIYQLVADKTAEQLTTIASVPNCSVSEMEQEADRPSDAELAQWWLDYSITRKITKRNCMTFPAYLSRTIGQAGHQERQRLLGRRFCP